MPYCIFRVAKYYITYITLVTEAPMMNKCFLWLSMICVNLSDTSKQVECFLSVGL